MEDETSSLLKLTRMRITLDQSSTLA